MRTAPAISQHIINNLIYNIADFTIQRKFSICRAPSRKTTGMHKLPVTIVSGFLGAGKTTLLNHLLSSEQGLRIAVLVNDFGSIEVDSRLIRNIEGETIGLANGCVCCTIRNDLVQALCDLMDRDLHRFDHIVIETSGVSDPAAAAMGVVMSTRLAGRLRLDATVTVVDAENVLELDGAHRALAVDQVRAADIVLVNKRDLVSLELLGRVQAWIKAEAPHARLVATEQCRAPLGLLFDVAGNGPDTTPEGLTTRREPVAPGAGHVHDIAHHDIAHDVTTWSWERREPLALEPVYQLFQRLPTEVFRAKGILNLAEITDRRVVLQVVGKRVQLSKGLAWGAQVPLSQVVMLGLGHKLVLERAAVDLDRCIRDKALPPSNRFVEAVINVLRGP